MVFFFIFQVSREGWHLRRKLVVLWRGLKEAESHWGRDALHWSLTLQHRYSGLSADPGGGWILVEVIASRVIAGSALVGPSIVQSETCHPQHTHCVEAISCADGHPPLTGAVPQLPERVGSVDLRVPPLDLWGGGTYHVTVQLKGVTCELCLGKRWFHKTRWWWFKMGSMSRSKTKKRKTGAGWKGKKIEG